MKGAGYADMLFRTNAFAAVLTQDTINAVIDAGALPMSILVVGVGQDTFGDMHVSYTILMRMCRAPP